MFDWSKAPEAAAAPVEGDYKPLPVGKYHAMIASVQDKETKAGTGHYFMVELIIIGDRYEGRKVWDIINYDNPNPKAVEIGFRTLVAIGRATGMPDKFDPLDLQDKCVMIEVSIDSQPGFEAKNKVKRYSSDAPVERAPTPVYAPQGNPSDNDLPF